MRRRFLVQSAALLAGAAAPSVFAQTSPYPNKIIKMIVSFGPVGSVDPIMRIIQPKMNESLGQTIVIENRPGGTTSIAAGAVTKSAPDGYTLLFTAEGTHVVHTIGRPQIPYHPINDFTPIAAVSRSGFVMAVHPSIPAKTIAEFVAYCKANPGKVDYASTGVGNNNHLAFERFALATGIKVTHVPYKETSAIIADFVPGRVQAFFSTTSVIQPMIDAGQIRALAYTATQEGDVPKNLTFTAAGLPEFENVDSLNVIMGPAHLPPAIALKLQAAVEAALALPEIKAAIQGQKQYAYFMTGEQLGARMRADLVKYNQIVKDANIKLEG
ncbi:MAG: tripartite tricarboxylate transporter substrate binding protein [Pseudomonadota bacterium]